MKKITLERYGDSGWMFRINFFDELGNEKTAKLRTNQIGDGLWEYTESSTYYADGSGAVMEWKQIDGNCQYSLPKDIKKAYNRLYFEYFTSPIFN